MRFFSRGCFFADAGTVRTCKVFYYELLRRRTAFENSLLMGASWGCVLYAAFLFVVRHSFFVVLVCPLHVKRILAQEIVVANCRASLLL